MRRFSHNKQRDNRDNEDDQSNKYPRLKITRVDCDTAMGLDSSSHHSSLIPSPSSLCPPPSSSYTISNYYNSQETTIFTSNASSQADVSNGLENMNIDNRSLNLRENATSATFK